ncbi:hypothetical protein [Aquimarina pacifica]|uniref:hypothetical protein n=1 Tax=Aquimarina pacifica TaxID=1296415 RepID=UPI000472D414|nr:hypothetical protein [Aquimarina pacifica]
MTAQYFTKLIISVTIYLIICPFIHAQDDALNIGGNYYFLVNYSAQSETPITALENAANTIEVKKGYFITISDITEENVIFTFWNFDSSAVQPINGFRNKYEKYNELNKDEKKYFTLSKEKFKQITSPYYRLIRKIDAGIYTIPFKFRMNEFEIESNVSLGTNLIFQLGLNRKSKNSILLDLTGGLALTKIDLNAGNSDIGKENTLFADEESSSKFAFTPSIGTIIHLTKSVNIGVFYGWDIFSKKDRIVNWKYERKPWLGLGINIGFTNSSEKNNNEPKEQTEAPQ